MSHLPCPACGFLTIRDYYGSYETCLICQWENDGIQLGNPTSEGGANRESLAEAQVKAVARFPLDVAVVAGFRRDCRWRPLAPEEIAGFESLRVHEHWHSRQVTDPKDVYWLRA